MKPFFTIITATYNAAATLPRLLDSLAVQTCRDFELIIQDGASTDNTVAVAESYRDKLPALSLVSEPDTGIYDAWNKALNRIRGEWVLFLGADDRLATTTVLHSCYNSLHSVPIAALYAGGGVELMGLDGRLVTQLPYVPNQKAKAMCGGMPFPHPSLWHHRTLFTLHSFDTSLRIAADYDFICRTWTTENGKTVLPFIVTQMYRGGISDLPLYALRLRWENARVASRYFTDVWTVARCIELLKGCILWTVCKIVGPHRAPVVLDAIKRLRGLPPSWTGL